MTDIGKALTFSVAIAFLFGVWLVSQLKYLRAYWHALMYAPVDQQYPVLTAVELFGCLLVGITLSLTMLLMLLFRRVGRRESGGMILETERGIRRGTMPGAERLRGELE